MRRLLLVSAALVALTGAAYAQEAPYLAGNYSGSVVRNHSAAVNRGSTVVIRDFDSPRVFRRGFGPRVVYRDRFRPRFIHRDRFAPRFIRRDRFRPRVVYRDRFRPSFFARDPFWDDYYWPGYRYRPRAGFTIGFGGPGWGIGFSDWR